VNWLRRLRQPTRGVIGILRSGRSDLSVRAKDIVRGVSLQPLRVLDDDGKPLHRCPRCSGQLRFDDGDLLEDGCGWSYTWGLNPRNPRAAVNEQRRPSWIPEGSSPPW
jgi:hypothetical protein